MRYAYEGLFSWNVIQLKNLSREGLGGSGEEYADPSRGGDSANRIIATIAEIAASIRRTIIEKNIAFEREPKKEKCSDMAANGDVPQSGFTMQFICPVLICIVKSPNMLIPANAMNMIIAPHFMQDSILCPFFAGNKKFLQYDAGTFLVLLIY